MLRAMFQLYLCNLKSGHRCIVLSSSNPTGYVQVNPVNNSPDVIDSATLFDFAWPNPWGIQKLGVPATTNTPPAPVVPGPGPIHQSWVCTLMSANTVVVDSNTSPVGHLQSDPGTALPTRVVAARLFNPLTDTNLYGTQTLGPLA